LTISTAWALTVCGSLPSQSKPRACSVRKAVATHRGAA
jgi:hypothetical protein